MQPLQMLLMTNSVNFTWKMLSTTGGALRICIVLCTYDTVCVSCVSLTMIVSVKHPSTSPLLVQAFLTHLLTVDLPKLMVLPKRLEINIPPAVTAVAEAAVGRDVVMRAVASAVLQADALENALIAALPLGPQSAAGGVSLPASFQGELQVSIF